MGSPKRVVVTGMGLVTPLGLDLASVQSKLFAGQTGIGPISAFDRTQYRSQNGGEVSSEALAAALDSQKWRPTTDRATDMLLVAAAQALRQASLLPPETETHLVDASQDEIAVLVGSGLGASQHVTESWETYYSQGKRGLRHTTIPRCMMNSVSSHVSISFGLKGPNYVISSACASSTIALGQGFRMIRNADVRRVLVGGTDAMFIEPLYAGWDKLGVMSRHSDPAQACRPFDLNRDGFVLGEGSGALVLESLADASSRGATIYAELLGYGESSDASHITRPSAVGQAAAMAAALRSASLQPKDIDFINAHGTATKANDSCESEAICQIFGPPKKQPWVVAAKSLFGHSLGASGVVETIAAIISLGHGRLHPNLNLEHPDPLCNLNLVGQESLDIPLKTCMKNSFGFGGGNAVLILGGPDTAV
ncbi:MAG: beta-ketoacyl-[acyl-carrier-protein] synthase family protein [Deltaproteobacteria bacterium]|nr:beta-ketoacyl-[acyl-carrier-protein] synthase family protein [Deltaproteobacteria bacterium]